MPVTPRPLAPSLLTAPFTVREALDRGESRRRLRARDLDASVWGVRSTVPTASLVERCELYSARLHDRVVFSHSTAALLFGAPLPFALELSHDLHITTPAPARAPHAAGIRGHRLTLEPHEIVSLEGLRCTSPARTWRDLGTQLSVLDLVAAGDHLIHHRAPLCTYEALGETVSRARSRRGLQTLSRALPLLDPRSESRPESHLRVLMKLGGLPEPRVNHTFVETDGGGALRPDFTFTPWKVVVEYQGDYHRTKEQWRKDVTRRSRLESLGGIVVEIDADDLRDPGELIERIARFLRRNGWNQE